MELVLRLGAAADLATLMVSSREGDAGRAIARERIGEIRRDQLAGIMSLAPVMMTANIVNAIALAILEHGVGHLTNLTLLWMISVALLGLKGLHSWVRFRGRGERRQASARASGKIVLSAITVALLWSYPPLVILPGSGPQEFGFVVALTAGMVAGGAIGFSAMPMAALTYAFILLCASIPIIVLAEPVQRAPFAMVLSMFFAVVICTTWRRAGSLLAASLGRMDQEARRQELDMLLEAHQGEGGHALWRTDATGRVTRGALALAQAFSLEASAWRPAAGLGALLGASKARLLEGDGAPIEALHDAIATGEAFDVMIETSAGEVLRLAGRGVPMVVGAHAGLHGFVQNVTKEVRARHEVERLAAHDPLTGLLNKRAFDEAAARMMSACASGCAVYFFVDADRLKAVNDSFGHAVGDAAIRAVAERLNRALSAGAATELALPGVSLPGVSLPRVTIMGGALAARKGGDEFVALCVVEDRSAAKRLARAVTARLNAPVEESGIEFMLSCSVGVSIREARDCDLGAMELEADRALYQVKKFRRSDLAIYDPRSGEALGRSRKLVHDIRAAVEEDRLDIVLQPILSLATGACLGAEALVRWRHRDFGDIPADATAAIAMESDVSAEFTKRILRRACVAAAPWAQGKVSINLCPPDLMRSGFAQEALRIADEAGLEPARLCLEISETGAATGSAVMASNIAALRGAGVCLAVDDFGAGYSTMAALDSYPVDVVKIDRSIVSGCSMRRSSAIMIKALVELADAGRFSLVAEGAASEADCDMLKRLGVEAAQSHLLSPPLRPEEMAAFIARRPMLSAAVAQGGQVATSRLGFQAH